MSELRKGEPSITLEVQFHTLHVLKVKGTQAEGMGVCTFMQPSISQMRRQRPETEGCHAPSQWAQLRATRAVCVQSRSTT